MVYSAIFTSKVKRNSNVVCRSLCFNFCNPKTRRMIYIENHLCMIFVFQHPIVVRTKVFVLKQTNYKHSSFNIRLFGWFSFCRFCFVFFSIFFSECSWTGDIISKPRYSSRNIAWCFPRTHTQARALHRTMRARTHTACRCIKFISTPYRARVHTHTACRCIELISTPYRARARTHNLSMHRTHIC